jgi:hypothetical protein
MGESKQSRLYEFGFEPTKKMVYKTAYPINSLCVSCGKVKWLNWVVDGKHLCDNCVKED